MTTPEWGIIGGTGLYQLSALEESEEVVIGTPYGAPSAPIVQGVLGGCPVAFLARHGTDHHLAPHAVNYRANVWALHQLGVRRVLGVNAVGGIRADMPPRALVVPTQIIDYTHGRADSFGHGAGEPVRHVDFSHPYSASMRKVLLAAAAQTGLAVVDGGCYGATQGPRLETCAEIERMRRDGCDLVGMTGMPEAVLARELGMEYACLALVANWAAGRGPEPAREIGMDEIFAHLAAATGQVPRLLRTLLAGS